MVLLIDRFDKNDLVRLKLNIFSRKIYYSNYRRCATFIVLCYIKLKHQSFFYSFGFNEKVKLFRKYMSVFFFERKSIMPNHAYYENSTIQRLDKYSHEFNTDSLFRINIGRCTFVSRRNLFSLFIYTFFYYYERRAFSFIYLFFSYGRSLCHV